MPKRYPPEFRGAVCARLVAGEKVRTMQFELREQEAIASAENVHLGSTHSERRPLKNR